MQVTKEVVSVSEMARMVGLSRARFYQLVREGVFPCPNKPNESARPFYTREQQELCVGVRKTNKGVNGTAVLFYAMRPPTTPEAPARQRTTRPISNGRTRQATTTADPLLTELRHSLMQLGLSEISETTLRTALADEYPDGYAEVDRADLVRVVFNHLNRRNTRDNLA